MGNEFSRRRCLLLLSGGAATVFETSVAVFGRNTAKAGPSQSNRQEPNLATQSVLENLKEFGGAHVYAPTPVQLRPEYTAPSKDAFGQMTLEDDWELTVADTSRIPGQYEAQADWIGTHMPWPIQYALMKAGRVENLWYGQNFKRLQWIQEQDWYLRRRFVLPELWRDSVIRLRFDGMDYYGMVWLDGEFLGEHEGSFGGPTFDISNRVTPGKEHELLIRTVHEAHDLLPNYESSSENHNPRVVKPDAQDAESYQWGNRYRSFGLYQPVRIIATSRAYMEAPFVRTESIGKDSAALWAQVMITNPGVPFQGEIEARIVEAGTGTIAWHQSSQQQIATGNSFWEHSLELKNPKLWWPNGLGDQPLYRLELTLREKDRKLDSITSRFGIRTLELKRNPSTPESPRVTPVDKTFEDEAYKYLWVANGKPFYIKGACWMTSDDVLLLSPEREEWMLRAAKLSGFNLMRLNGGTSIFESEQFYNFCDEMGIIVWQEVPLNWADTPGTTTLAVWREQLTQNVLRIRQHPSIGIYVGGNEFDPFADGIEALLGLVREIFAAYDGSRAFRMNSPCGGDYHAYEPQEIYTADENWYHKIFDRGHYFISEWSFSGFANLSLLKRMIPAPELERKPVGYDVDEFKLLYPTIRDRSAELWYTFNKSWQKATWYNDFGKADVPMMIECSQMGYEHNMGVVLEQWRAQFPYTGGEALWTYNSLGPVANSWHLIDWCGQPQIPFYAAKRANEPVHVMADTGFFSWGPGDTFRASVFALNDRPEVLENAQIRARIYDQELRVAHEERWKTEIPADGYMSEKHEVQWPIPAATAEGYLFLELTLNDLKEHTLSRRMYWLRIAPMLADPAERKRWQAAPVPELVNEKGPWLIPQVQAALTTLNAAIDSAGSGSGKEAGISITVENTGKSPAYPVSLEIIPDVYSVLWTDNYFWLAPGERVTVQGIVRLDMSGLDAITNPPIGKAADLIAKVSAWNAAGVQLRLK